MSAVSHGAVMQEVMNSSSVGKALAFPTSQNEAMRAFGVPDSILRDVRPLAGHVSLFTHSDLVPRVVEAMFCSPRCHRPLIRRP